MSANPNRLLFVISARGQMSWADYCQAVDYLATITMGERWISRRISMRSVLLQCLEALGHYDVWYDEGQSSITVAPPSLCRLPRAGLPVAVLAGARCLKTQKKLVEAAGAQGGAIQITTERHPGPHGLIPDTVLLKAESEDALAAFTASLGLRCPHIPPAWTLVNWCGRLSEYEATLDYRVPENFGWTRYDFSIRSHAFLQTQSESLPRLSRYRNPTTTLPVHVFFRDGSGAEVGLNWGRYLLINARSITVTAYDEKRYRLCIPVAIPLPSVIARSICLCSGRPPVHRSAEALVPGFECRDWLMFEDVPPQIAMAALSKVGQTPEKVQIR